MRLRFLMVLYALVCFFYRQYSEPSLMKNRSAVWFYIDPLKKTNLGVFFSPNFLCKFRSSVLRAMLLFIS